MKRIRVINVEPNKPAEVIEVDNTLKCFQSIVGGYIECVYPWPKEDVALVCNEEGKLTSLSPNRYIGNDLIVGTFVIVGVKGDNFASVTEQQAKRIVEELNKDQCIYLN